MKTAEPDTFTIEIIEGENGVVLKGAMRLQSPTAYETPFNPIVLGIQSASSPYKIDIKDLEFLNSSGVTALARIVLLARQSDKALLIVCSDQIPWQNKTVSSLQKLHPKLEIVTV